MEAIKIIVPGEPASKGRPRIGKTKSGMAIAFTPAKTRSREGVIASLAIDAMKGRAPLEGPLFLSLVAIFAIPKSFSKSKRADALAFRLMPTKKPDVDNIVKIFGDSLNEIVWVDDVQVVEIMAIKRYGEVPMTIIAVSPFEPPDFSEVK